MRVSKLLPRFTSIVVLSLMGTSLSLAQDPQIKTSYIDLGTWAVLRLDRAGLNIPAPAVLYQPVTPGDKSQIAVLLMDPDRDYLAHSVCIDLSKRGYRVLCANSDVVKTQFSRDITMDGIMADVGSGVAYLRQYPGVRKVVLLGHGEGGALMSAYQNVAENGLKACQGPEKIVKCSDDVGHLTPADGVMLIDSDWGPAAMMLFSLDPAVLNEEGGQPLNPAMDMYNSANGFKPAGSSYSDEFTRKFFSTEEKRYNELIKAAQDRMDAIDAGRGHYSDNEPFFVPGAGLADANLYAQDLRLMSHTRKAWQLMHADGSITTQVIRSVRLPASQTSPTQSFRNGALRSTVRGFLKMYSIRTTDSYGYDEDSVHGVEWSSNYSNPPGNVQGITFPLLVMGMTGHWEYLASETIFENAKSADKTLIFVEGASHDLTTCKDCEKHPGQFGDTQKTTYDYIDKWLSQKGRFINQE